MNLDDAIREKLAKFTSWFQVVDFNNTNTIEDFTFRDGVPKEGVAGHCQKCITVNKCYFKDEINKKPEEFDYSNSFSCYNFSDCNWLLPIKPKHNLKKRTLCSIYQ